MSIFKCKICGGSLAINTQSRIAMCEYCGTKQSVPLFADENTRVFYERGNSYLLHSEFDKAENVFNQLLSVCPDEAELYWDLVLCKYGITYVKDPKTNQYIPTCNRTQYSSILNDENYQKAIKLSSKERGAIYKADAEKIAHIQKEIIKISKKEKPFDIFISYKETDANGNRTYDSVMGQKLYEEFTKLGYKVFYSRITLEDKIGAEYEPYIYSALYSSRVMLTVCSSKANIESVWVKNEWSRYLTMCQKGMKKTLIPLYYNMSKNDLPAELAYLSAKDMRARGFIQELSYGIKKLIPLPIMVAQRRKKIRKVIATVASIVCICGLIIGGIYYKNYRDEQKALELERQEQEYYGNAYSEAMTLFENGEYKEAANAFSAIREYKDSVEMIEKCEIQPQYDEAMNLYHNGEYVKSAKAFEDLGEYEDAADMKKQSELSWRKMLANIFTNDSSPYSANQYYIADNGMPMAYDGVTSDTSLLDTDVMGHGKAISLARADPPYVLYEDGYVSNVEKNNGIEDASDWHDIIKISPILSATNIALRSDGSMVYGSLKNKEYEMNMEWLKAISKWENIVDFTWEISWSEPTGSYVNAAVVLGVKDDGTVCGAISKKSNHETDELKWFSQKELDSILSHFNNVKKISIYQDKIHENPSRSWRTWKIVALTKDGKVCTYQDGKYEKKDVSAIDLINTDYAIQSNGSVYSFDENKIVGQNAISGFGADVANVYWVSKTGKIYTTGKRKEFSYKVATYDEWSKRMG